ncbi:MAG TPA: protein-L-isoaspartate(D-aspartate) O-methyltransferase [Methanoregula sp.]|nr:protein-L-isoaspartate(D-aspartate) O-methyltransferase [Methanoregula sp.]
MNQFPRSDERNRMVERQIEARGVRNPGVLAAMREIPRHLFIPPPYDRSAYEDSPLPIGNGQTISQPYIVALMTELLKPEPEDNVLEIGTGCGYQAAILAKLVRKVTSIERIPAVADLARSNLAALGISNVEIQTADGTLGYPENAPYNGIIITAATPSVPKPLIEQLAENGRLVAPVGGREIQELVVLSRRKGIVSQELHGGVRFVPLIGEHGWEGGRES